MSTQDPEVIRNQLHETVLNDLLGPAEGPEEEVVEASVRVRYLVGQLAPSGALLEPEEQDDLQQQHSAVSDDGESEEERLQSRSLMPSSLGLTRVTRQRVCTGAGKVRA